MRPMLAATLLPLTIALAPGAGFAQVGGNINYGASGSGGPSSAGHAQAVAREQAIRQVGRDELPPTDSTLYLTAGVLLNVKADEFVATFAVAEEGETVAQAQGRMDRTVESFVASLRPLGIDPEATFVDFTAQTRLSRYDVEGNLARERPAGFEIKKTVAIRYRDKLLIDRLVAAAAESRIYDLVRVDYVVTDLYDSYTPVEAEAVVGGYNRPNLVVQSLRRGRTFFYHPLDADGYDAVVNPVIVEPVVQFTTFLKLRYEIETRR